MTSTMLKTQKATDALKAAAEAGRIAALAVWDRDEHQDRGSCGGAMLELDARTVVARQALALGLAHKSGNEVYLSLPFPEGVRSQNADIPQVQYKAFRDSLEAAGFGKAVKRHWTYTD